MGLFNTSSKNNKDFHMQRSLQEWAHLAEIIGGIAIILSLIFVGLQVSENSKQVRSETAHNVTAGLQSWYNQMGGSAQVSAVFRKGKSDPESLSKDEAVQYLMSVHSVMLIYQTMYFLGAEGTLDEEMNTAMSSALKAALPTPGFTWYWEQRSEYFTKEFQAFVKEIVATAPDGGAKIYQ
jgi:hypothetical protein